MARKSPENEHSSLEGDGVAQSSCPIEMGLAALLETTEDLRRSLRPWPLQLAWEASAGVSLSTEQKDLALYTGAVHRVN